MNIKKMIAVAVSMVMVCLIIPIDKSSENTASAETEIWDGTYDTSWYDEEEAELHISTAEELAGLSELVNAGHTMEGQTIYLDNDIYLNDVSDYDNWETDIPANQWLSIGGKAGYYYFDGVFDGQGRTITGAYIDAFSSPHEIWVGFFGMTGTNTIIKNVNFDFAYVEGRISYSKYTAGVCAYNQGFIINCEFNGIIKKVNVDGLANSTDYNSHCGAICGFNENGTISECIVDGSITVDIYNNISYVGGVCGYNISGYINKCSNKANIFSTVTYSEDAHNNTGGICGYSDATESIAISDCCNYGDIISMGNSYYTNCGGICGTITESDCLIENCYNRGAISCDHNAGGIIGEIVLDSSYIFTINNTYNTGAISNGGGIIGVVNSRDNPESFVMTSCYYLSDSALCGVQSGIDNTIAKNSSNMQKESFVESLGEAFVYNDGGYPLLAWELELQQEPLMGDVNLDGIFDIADIKLLQDYLVCRVTLTAEQGAIADVYADNVLNCFDLCVLKRMYLEQSETA